VCRRNVKSTSEIVEVQVVDRPIPDSELQTVQNMLLTIASANGAQWISHQADLNRKILEIQYDGMRAEKVVGVNV